MTTSLAMSASTSSSNPTPTSTPKGPHHQPALLPLLFPYLLTFLRKSINVAFIIPKYTIPLFSSLLRSVIISPLTYILAPFTTFAAILFSVTLRTPWNFLTWLIETLFPLYVFCGVACITGAFLGLGGRVICMGITRTMQDDGEVERKQYEKPSMKIGANSDLRNPKRRRLEREVKFKSEQSDDE